MTEQVPPLAPAGKTVAVTGASGFIGAAVLRTLQSRGFHVRPLVRSLQKLPPALREQARVVDLQDAENVAQATHGIAAIVHLAFDMRAPGATSGPHAASSTQNVVRAAALANARFVLASSYSVIDWMKAGEVVGTESPTVSPDGLQWYGPYAHQKAAQERLTRQLCLEQSVPLSILRPGKVWDNSHRPWDVIGPRLAGRQLVVRPTRQAQVIDLQACAEAFADACESTASFEIRHLVSANPITVEALAHQLADAQQVLKVPSLLVNLLHAVSPFAGLAFKAGLKVPGLLLWPRIQARYPLAQAPACHRSETI